jgi:Tfp pilus assembly protein PilN
VVVLPPLIQARALALPRLKPDELQAVIERSPERYFAIAREPHLVAVTVVRNRVLAAVLPLRVAQTIRKELELCNVSVSSIACAHEAWLAAVPRTHRTGRVAVKCGPAFELLELSRRTIVNLRRVPGAALTALPHQDAILTVPIESAGEMAARDARRARRLVFHEPAERENAERARWRKAVAYFLSAAVMFSAAGSIELKRQKHQLADLREARAALGAELGAAIATQHAALESRAALRSLQALEADGQRWTKLITRVARIVPEDAVLASIRVRGDSVTFEGHSLEPRGTFAALHDSRLFADLTVANPVVREQSPDGGAKLRFVFAGRIAKDGLP